MVEGVAWVPTLAVSETGPEVALLQTAVPLVASLALLMVMSSGSGLVQAGRAAMTN